MEAFGILLALVVSGIFLATPVLALWAVVAIRRERRERAELEQRLARLEWFQSRSRSAAGAHVDELTPAVAEADSRDEGPGTRDPGTAGVDQRVAIQDELAPEVAIDAAIPAEPPIAAPPPVEMPSNPMAPDPLFPPQPAGPSWEERLAGRLPIWLGAIALVLAGAFLVKFSIDRGLLGPPVRVALGISFGVVLLGLGEWLRRRDDRIAQACSAAGVAVLFVVVWAATALWGLLSPWLGFAFLALVTTTGVALSLRQGPIVAVVGLVGGLLAPVLAGNGADRPAVLFSYLLLLSVAILAVAGRRGWNALAAVSLVGTVIWTLGWLADVGPERVGETPIVAGFLVLLALAFFVVPALGRGRGASLGTGATPLAAAALLTTLVAAGLTTGVGRQGPFEWAALALLSAATLVLAAREARFSPLPWLAAAVTVAALLARFGRIPALPAEHLGTDATPLADPTLVPVIAGFWALFTVGAYLAHRHSPRPVPLLALVACASVVLPLLALAAADRLGIGLPEGVVMLVVGALLVAAALPVAGARRGGVEWATAGLGALAAGASACAALAVPLELERAWITVAWAFEAWALVWLAGRLDLPLLRHLGLLVGGGVALRLLANPAVLDYPTGDDPVWSWLLYGYGVSTVAAVAAARTARASGARRTDAAFTALALALLAAWWLLSVRQFFHPGNLDAPRLLFVEWGALATGWAVLGTIWSHRSGTWLGGEWAPIAGRLLTGAALSIAIVGPLTFANPSFSGQPVTPLGLLLAYAAPAALLLGRARTESRRARPRWMALWGVGALLLVWSGSTQAVRFGFRGSELTGPTSSAEGFAVSAVWILIGIALLVVGVRISSRPARYAALAMMGLAAGKVFLFDVGELEDLWRVASFLGLGASLLILAGVYRRFILGRDAP